MRVVVEFCVVWSRPAMARVWPSRSSTTVRALRWSMAGTRPPLIVVPAPKLSWLKTGSTSSRITSLARMWGRKLRIAPKLANWTVTTAVPPGIDELCGTGYGKRPPARNRAGWPSSAIRFGSARSLARAFDRRALRKSENWPALKMPKSWALFGVADAAGVERRGDPARAPPGVRSRPSA